MPAIATQLRKKIEIFAFQKISSIKKVQIRPAAKNPLYRPWFAARDFVGSNMSLGNFLKIFLPLVVQANISNQRKYRCSAATIPIKIVIVSFIVYLSSIAVNLASTGITVPQLSQVLNSSEP